MPATVQGPHHREVFAGDIYLPSQSSNVVVDEGRLATLLDHGLADAVVTEQTS